LLCCVITNDIPLEISVHFHITLYLVSSLFINPISFVLIPTHFASGKADFLNLLIAMGHFQIQLLLTGLFSEKCITSIT